MLVDYLLRIITAQVHDSRSITCCVNHSACMYVCSGPVMSHPHRLVLEISLLVVVDIIAGNALGKGLSLYGVV